MTPRDHTIRVVDSPVKQRRHYDDLVDHISSNGINPFDPADGGVHLAWLTLYASAKGYLDEKNAIVLGAPSSKATAFVDMLMLFDSVPTVVFVTSSQLIDRIRREMPAKKVGSHKNVLAVDASHGQADTRDMGATNEFLSGSKDMLLTTTHRDIGLTYPRARRAVFLQRPWHPGAVSWIENALPTECTVTYYETDGTVDRLWPYTLDRLAPLATSADVVRDLMKGRFPHGEQEDPAGQEEDPTAGGGGDEGSDGTHRTGKQPLPNSRNVAAGLARRD